MIALIAATEFETGLLRQQLSVKPALPGGVPRYGGRLFGHEITLIHCGIGKANAAAATTSLLCNSSVQVIINIGCGGALYGGRLQVGDLALATAEIFADEGSQSNDGFLDFQQMGLPLYRARTGALYNHLPVDQELTVKARPTLEDFSREAGIQFEAGPFITVSTCTGTNQQGEERARAYESICETMEGAAIALVAARFELPLLEIRGISNIAGDRNKDEWDLPGSCRTAQSALLKLLQQWSED